MKYLLILVLLVSLSGCGPTHKVMKNCKKIDSEYSDCEVP